MTISQISTSIKTGKFNFNPDKIMNEEANNLTEET